MSWWTVFVPATEARLAKALGDGLARAGVGTFVYDAEGHSLATENSTIHLGSLYSEFLATSVFRRPAFVRSVVAAFASAPARPQTFEEAEPHLVVRVRDRLFFSMMPFYAPDIDPAYEIVGEDFALSLAIDSEHAVSDVTRADLERWGRTFEDLVPLGRHRLVEASEPARFEALEPGLFRSAYRDVYDASRIALPGLLRTLGVRGRPVVSLPNRNTLFVAGADDRAALLALMRRTDDVLASEPRPQSGRCLVLDGTAWMPFRPSDPELARVVVERERLDRARDRNEQKAALEAHFAREGRDVFVAEVGVAQAPVGDSFSYAVWVEGVDDALMPESDYVVFVWEDRAVPTMRVPWSIAQAHVGHRMTAQGWYPERFGVTSFPTAEELAAMRGHAV